MKGWECVRVRGLGHLIVEVKVMGQGMKPGSEGFGSTAEPEKAT